MKAVLLITALFAQPALAEIMPEWVSHMRAPKNNTTVFSVGYAEGEDLNAVMSAAWSSALSNVVKTNLTEVVSLGEMSREGLRGADYSRVSELDLDRVSPIGISESDKSPYIQNLNGKYKVWRLLEWSKSGLEATKKTIISEQAAIKNRKAEFEEINDGYVSNNKISNSRISLEESKKALSKLQSNNSLAKRLQITKLVLMQLECGINYWQVEEVLGYKGIRVNGPYDQYSIQFGEYRVEQIDGYISAIRDLSGRLVRDVCQ